MVQADLSIDRITRSRRNRFTSVRLDRLVEYRENPEWVVAAQNSNAARFVPLWHSRSLLSISDEGQVAVYLKPGELDKLDAILQGALDEVVEALKFHAGEEALKKS